MLKVVFFLLQRILVRIYFFLFFLLVTLAALCSPSLPWDGKPGTWCDAAAVEVLLVSAFCPPNICLFGIFFHTFSILFIYFFAFSGVACSVMEAYKCHIEGEDSCLTAARHYIIIQGQCRSKNEFFFSFFHVSVVPVPVWPALQYCRSNN